MSNMLFFAYSLTHRIALYIVKLGQVSSICFIYQKEHIEWYKNAQRLVRLPLAFIIRNKLICQNGKKKNKYNLKHQQQYKWWKEKPCARTHLPLTHINLYRMWTMPCLVLYQIFIVYNTKKVRRKYVQSVDLNVEHIWWGW